MSIEILADIEALFAKAKATFLPQIKTVENDVKAIVSSSVAYIESNGLQDVYQIALSIVGGFATGTPWLSILASVEAAIIADGKAIEKGALSVITNQAQADLIALGKVLPPAAVAPGAA